MMVLLLPTICILSCFFSIWLQVNNFQKLALKTKLLASLCFVGFAYDLGALESFYGQLILTGLVLSLIGDVLLAMQGNRKELWFMYGIISFLLAHVIYAVSFASTGIATEKLPLVLPIVMISLIIIGLWLRPYLQGLFKIAVPIYMVVIHLMLVFAWSNQSITAWIWIVSGASLFAISDLFVARNRFVKSELTNPLLGRPLYYFAQLMLAYTVASI